MGICLDRYIFKQEDEYIKHTKCVGTQTETSSKVNTKKIKKVKAQEQPLMLPLLTEYEREITNKSPLKQVGKKLAKYEGAKNKRFASPSMDDIFHSGDRFLKWKMDVEPIFWNFKTETPPPQVCKKGIKREVRKKSPSFRIGNPNDKVKTTVFSPRAIRAKQDLIIKRQKRDESFKEKAE